MYKHGVYCIHFIVGWSSHAETVNRLNELILHHKHSDKGFRTVFQRFTGSNREAVHRACRMRSLFDTHQWQSALLTVGLLVCNLNSMPSQKLNATRSDLD